MAQLSLYITDGNLETLRSRSAAAGVSMSKYVNQLIERDAEDNGWSAGFWGLYGSIDDESFVAPPDPPALDDSEFETMFAKAQGGGAAVKYLDTSICIDFLHGRLQAGYRELREGAPGGFALPAIVAAELFHGAEHSANPSKGLDVVGAFVDAFQVIPFDAACAREYGRLRQEFAAAGSPIGDRDTMIAATALANRAAVVTANEKDFSRVKGLQVEVWVEVEL